MSAGVMSWAMYHVGARSAPMPKSDASVSMATRTAHALCDELERPAERVTATLQKGAESPQARLDMAAPDALVGAHGASGDTRPQSERNSELPASDSTVRNASRRSRWNAQA